jgi:hypothetical protein
MTKEKETQKNETWQIVKKTENYKYFDCGLEKNETTGEGTSSETKFVSWCAVITKIAPSGHGRYGKYSSLEREFVECRGFKDLNPEHKYPVLHNLIMKDAIIEIGRKTSFFGGYPTPVERSYRYYKIIDITETEITIKIISKQQVLDSFKDHGLIRRKQMIINDITKCETDNDIFHQLTKYYHLYRAQYEDSKEDKN